MRTDRWKLIHYYQFDEWELFDLQEDPDELANLFGRPEVRDLTVELAQELGRLQAYYGDESATGPMPAEWRAQYR